MSMTIEQANFLSATAAEFPEGSPERCVLLVMVGNGLTGRSNEPLAELAEQLALTALAEDCKISLPTDVERN